MRRVLAALALLVAVVMLYQGLVTGGFIAGPANPLSPEAATFLLIAGGAMVIGAVTVRWSAGIAAIEMALAGLVTIGIADPTHRYLAAYGVVALILALAAMLVDLVPGPTLRQVLVPPARVEQHDPAQAHHQQLPIRIETVGAHQRAPIRRRRRDRAGVSYQRLLARIARVRARQQAERQVWRAGSNAARMHDEQLSVPPAAASSAGDGLWPEAYVPEVPNTCPPS